MQPCDRLGHQRFAKPIALELTRVTHVDDLEDGLASEERIHREMRDVVLSVYKVPGMHLALQDRVIRRGRHDLPGELAAPWVLKDLVGSLDPDAHGLEEDVVERPVLAVNLGGVGPIIHQDSHQVSDKGVILGILPVGDLLAAIQWVIIGVAERASTNGPA